MSTAAEQIHVENPLQAAFDRQRKAFAADPYPDAQTRIDRITRVINLLVDEQADLCEAIQADYGRRSIDSTRMAEIMGPIATLKYARSKVRKWMKPHKRRASFPFNLLGANAHVSYMPLGVVGNVSPWNFPVALALSPLGGIFAAGNRAMLKPSEFTPHTSETLVRLIAKYFEPDELTVIKGGVDVAAQFCALPFDHLLFTGSTQVGAKILQATAPNLVPTTLELGGKSPVIIDDDVDLETAAKKIAFAKTTNSGQICIAPDYVMVTEKNREPFIKAYVEAVKTMFPDGTNSADFGHIISIRHSERLREMAEEASAKGNKVIEIFAPGPGVGNSVGDARMVGPSVIDISNADCRLMQEEIFGPLLPVLAVPHLQAAIDRVNSGDRPLALYLFSTQRETIDRVSRSTVSGGMVINDLMLHYMQDDLPFGGVGASGMGAYHGPEGFKTFAHAKAVFVAPRFDVAARLRPPFGKLFRFFVNSQISK